MFAALKKGDLGYLRVHRAKIGARARDGDTLLHRAQTAEAARALLRLGAPLDRRNDDGETPLIAALNRNQEDVARVLVAAGARLDLADRDGCTPLFLAQDPDTVRLMVARGADPNARDGYEGTPLHEAVAKSADVCEALLVAGADPDAQDDRGDTPLHLAASDGLEEEVALLLRHGAGRAVRNNGGRTPADVARLFGHGDLADALEP